MMKKAMFLLTACVAVAAFANVVLADDLALWFDERDAYADIATPIAPYVNNAGGGVAGDAQIAYVSPVLAGGEHNPGGAFDSSIGSLTLYADFTTAVGSVLASLGLDVAIAAPAAGEYGLDSAVLTTWNAAADVGGGLTNAAWDGYTTAAWTAIGGDYKAVQVPVTDPGTGPAFDVTTGIVDGDGYRLATIALQGSARGANVATGSLAVTMSVNGLLITQVDAASTAGNLDLYFGYVGGVLEASTANPGAGVVAGATSATADAIIDVRMKGDFDANGSVDNSDVPLFLAARGAAVGTLNRLDTYCGDFDGNGDVDNSDVPSFLASRALP